MATNVTDIPVPLSLQLQDPKDVIIARGQPATLKCEAHSTAPGLHFRWLFNDVLIPINDTRTVQKDDGSLLIPKVAGKRFDSLEGKYRCIATNNIGSVLSNPAALKIASKFYE